MKKKIIGLAVAASLMLTGVVSAASMWGSYKGNEIIRIVDISNNKTVIPKDVPAISYNGRTMIPISMLGDIGIDYGWDQKNKTVELINSKNASSNEFVSETEFAELNKVMQSHRALIFFMDQNELISICISLMNNSITTSDYNKSLQDVNRINITALQDWVTILTSIGSNRATDFQQITNYMKEAKENLLSGDYSLAQTNHLAAKVSINNTYTKLNQDVSNTFAVKNSQK